MSNWFTHLCLVNGLILLVKSVPDFKMTGFAKVGSTELGTYGSNDSKIVIANTVEELKNYAESDEPLTIQINKTLSAAPHGQMIDVHNHKTIIGIGSNGFLDGVGLNISNRRNIIVRNLKFTMSSVNTTHINSKNHSQVYINDGDCIHIGSSKDIWIDHNEFFSIDPAVQTEEDLFDGLVDITHDCEFITVSWNYFHDHHKCTLIGASDHDIFDRKITLHHNWYRNIMQRTPSFRFGFAHIYNSYFDKIIIHGIRSRMGACIRIERNYFENAHNPIMDTGSLEPGFWRLYDNYFVNSTGEIPDDSSCDRQLPYQYSLDKDTTLVKQTVTQWAGVGKI